MKKYEINSDQTGRYFVVDLETKRTFLVEPIGTVKTAWGDINPATKKTEGSYGKKFKGSIDKKESIINEENGFKNIITLEKGENPLDYIEKLLGKY